MKLLFFVFIFPNICTSFWSDFIFSSVIPQYIVQSNIQSRIEMNILLREGVCISPPFPRLESICNAIDIPTLRNGYHFEMHTFDGVNYARNISAMKQQYQMRHERIKNCTHDWDKNEMGILMKSREEMEKSHGWK